MNLFISYHRFMFDQPSLLVIIPSLCNSEC